MTDYKTIVGWINSTVDSGTHYFYEYNITQNSWSHLYNFTSQGNFDIREMVKTDNYFYYYSRDGGTNSEIYKVEISTGTRTTIYSELDSTGCVSSICKKSGDDIFFGIRSGSMTIGVYEYDESDGSYSLYYNNPSGASVPNANIAYDNNTGRLGVANISYGGATPQYVYTGDTTYSATNKAYDIIKLRDGSFRFEDYYSDTKILPYNATSFTSITSGGSSEEIAKEIVSKTEDKFVLGKKWGADGELEIFGNDRAASTDDLNLTNNCNRRGAGNDDLSIVVYSISSSNTIGKVTGIFNTPSETTVSYPNSLSNDDNNTIFSEGYSSQDTSNDNFFTLTMGAEC